jgi:hypothetical protein
MKNLRSIISKYTKVNKFIFKRFTENVKPQAEQFTNEKSNENKTEEVRQNNTDASYMKKFSKLWKHTFNYNESIEDIIEKRKAEAILRKSNIVELTDEQAERVK